jgi:hypothetical protein
MSVQNVRAAIERFLADPNPQVLCIRGAWGTGKTYTWKDMAKVQRDKRDGIALKQYAYVSLFGLNTLSEMKVQIVQNTTTTAKIGEFIDEETIRDALDKAEGPAKKAGMWLLQTIMGNRFDSAIAAMSAMISKQIVVFDDLERKGAKLSNADIFGYASYLKSERDCKVVLLLNHEHLSDADKDSFDSYLEKVVDVSLEFTPTIVEIADIAVPLAKRDKIGTWLHENATLLGITNIRVIWKIEAMARDVAPMLAEYSETVTKNAVHTLTLFGWSYLQPKSAPPLEYLKTAHPYSTSGSTAELDVAWRDILLKYNFIATTPFDLVLIEGMKKGFFQKVIIDQHAPDLHRSDILAGVEAELRDIWMDWTYSFVITQEQFLDRMYEFFTREVGNLSLGSMVAIEAEFREFGDDRAKDIPLKFIEANSSNPGAFDIEHLEMFGTNVHRTLKDQLLAALQGTTPKLSKDEIFGVLHDRGFEPEIYEAAALLPVDDYIQALKSPDRGKVSNLVRGFRQYLRSSGHPMAVNTVMEKAGLALREISKESDINLKRAMKTGLIQKLEAQEGIYQALSQMRASEGAEPASTDDSGENDWVEQ